MEKCFQHVEQELQRVPQELHGIPTKNSNQIIREVGNETSKCDVQVHGVSLLCGFLLTIIIIRIPKTESSSSQFLHNLEPKFFGAKLWGFCEDALTSFFITLTVLLFSFLQFFS